MLSRFLPTTRELLTAVLAVLLTLTVTNLFQPARAVEAGPTTKVVFVATGDNFPDALGAAAAAGALLAPVLLVAKDSVPADTMAELQRLEPEKIIIVGGTGVVSDGVKSTLEGLGFAPTVTRESGANRYATAAALSAASFPTHGLYPMGAYAGGDQSEGVTATDEIIRSVSLTAPVDGMVIVTSTATVAATVGNSTVRCSITTGTEIDAAWLQVHQNPGGTYGALSGIAGTRGFEVLAGETLTANLVCDHNGISGSGLVADSTMAAIFLADI